MTKRCANSDSGGPSSKKNADQSNWDPRLYLLCDLISITDGLETWGLDLLFFHFFLKHILSLVGQERFHQDELAPNAGPHGYQGTFLGHHATFGSSLLANELLLLLHLCRGSR